MSIHLFIFGVASHQKLNILYLKSPNPITFDKLVGKKCEAEEQSTTRLATVISIKDS